MTSFEQNFREWILKLGRADKIYDQHGWLAIDSSYGGDICELAYWEECICAINGYVWKRVARGNDQKMMWSALLKYVFMC